MGVAVEQEKLQGLWVFAFGALTPVFCFLVLLTLNPEGQSDDDIRCEIAVCDDFVFQIDTNTNPMRYRTRATWWRSRPAHNLQRSNGAGPPCHPRTPPKAAQPKVQIRAAVQTMLTAKRNVGTTCENVKRFGAWFSWNVVVCFE